MFLDTVNKKSGPKVQIKNANNKTVSTIKALKSHVQLITLNSPKALLKSSLNSMLQITQSD